MYNDLIDSMLESEYPSRFILELRESSVDFPKPSLDLEVWEKDGNVYHMRQDVKDKILRVLSAYEPVDLLDIAREIRITGSIGTNLYTEDADLDVHIVPKDFSIWDDSSVKALQIWFNENMERLDGYVGQHPIEVYIQRLPAQDLMSDSAYDLVNGEWIVGPKIVSQSYDPYANYSHIVDDIRSSVEDADLLMSELKRDTVDFEVIKKALSSLSGKDKKRVQLKLQNKLREMEKDIDALYHKRKEWIDARADASRPNSPEQALQDVELAKKWNDTNATFKFISRYQYLTIIGDLQKLIADDNQVTPDEVDVIRNIMR